VKQIIVIALILSVLPMASAAHYIVGQADDGKTVYLWYDNPINNITDVVGVIGNSNVASTYMIDCEMLYACNIGNVLKVGFNPLNYVSVTVTGAGYDVAPTLRYQAPVVPITTPKNDTVNKTVTNKTITVISNVTVYNNPGPAKKVVTIRPKITTKTKTRIVLGIGIHPIIKIKQN
jgi:hypothetical protein